MNLVLYALAKCYYVWKNNRREKIWRSWTAEERLRYLETTTIREIRGSTLDLRISGLKIYQSDEYFLFVPVQVPPPFRHAT